MSTTRSQPTLVSVSGSTVPAWIVLVYAAWNALRLSSSTMIDSEGLAMYVSRMALPLLLDRLARSNAWSASMHHMQEAVGFLACQLSWLVSILCYLVKTQHILRGQMIVQLTFVQL